MPKLSEKSLDKRYTCHYCGKSLRTLQGLSGHIQFKHKSSSTDASEVDKMLNWRRKMKLWEWSAKELNYSADITELGNQIINRWLIVNRYLELLRISVSEKDFKEYFIHNFGTCRID